MDLVAQRFAKDEATTPEIASTEFQLVKAAQTGEISFIKKHLDAEFSVNTAVKRDGTTLLMIATENGQTNCVRELLAVGANVNIERRDGDTALLICAEKGNVESLKELIQAGANVNAPNRRNIKMTIQGKNCDALSIL